MEHPVAKSYEDILNTLTVSCNESKTVSHASSMMKSIVAPGFCCRFAVILICCIAFGWASSACC